MLTSRMGAALAAVVSLALLHCGKSTDDGIGEQEGRATIGRPTAPIMGEYAQTARGIELRLKKADGGTIVRVATGWDPLTVENNRFGQPLNKNPEQRSGWFSNTTWKCVDAEMFATDGATSPDPQQDCYLEINSTAGTGISVVIIGLDAQGRGLTSWSGTPGSTPALVNGGAPQPVSAGPPRTVNVTIDKQSVVDAMIVARDRFHAPVEERNDCLKNARAAQWLDIQAHYYCLLPYSDVRNCYSTRLVEGATNPDPQIAARAAPAAYDACFKNATSGNQKWLHDNQEAVFKYDMFTRQGRFDFELKSENEVISDYYARSGQKRPRRIIDTYPEWLPDQPRYEVIRKAQIEAQRAGGT